MSSGSGNDDDDDDSDHLMFNISGSFELLARKDVALLITRNSLSSGSGNDDDDDGDDDGDDYDHRKGLILELLVCKDEPLLIGLDSWRLY